MIRQVRVYSEYIRRLRVYPPKEFSGIGIYNTVHAYHRSLDRTHLLSKVSSLHMVELVGASLGSAPHKESRNS